MNVRAEGHGNPGSKLPQHFRVIQGGNGETENSASHGGQSFNAPRQGFPGLSPQIGKRKAVLPHGLNHHGVTAPDQDRLYMICPADLQGIGNSGLHNNPELTANLTNKKFVLSVWLVVKISFPTG
jgi:hypothetical protein